MIRLHLVVEGQTEEAFVNLVLGPHLATSGIGCAAQCVHTSKVAKGGATTYARIHKDIQKWIKQEKKNRDAYFSSMFDLYKLPIDFPNYESAIRRTDPRQRIHELETAFAESVDSDRFIPYIQLHEFEALLFADPNVLLDYFPARKKEVETLVRLAAAFDSPELINHNPETAPSKRIIKVIPDYAGDKVGAGPISASKIGLPKLPEKCRHFHEWISKLEQLTTTTT